METEVPGNQVGTLIIDLDDISLDEVLSRPDSALAQAVEQVTRSVTDDNEHLPVARFSNFV